MAGSRQENWQAAGTLPGRQAGTYWKAGTYWHAGRYLLAGRQAHTWLAGSHTLAGRQDHWLAEEGRWVKTYLQLGGPCGIFIVHYGPAERLRMHVHFVQYFLF
jgi:hypothetical protein